MAFKRFRAKRGRTFRRHRAPLARKRRTWITSLRTGCTPLIVPWDPGQESCAVLSKFILVDNALLESGFSDRATVRRILGDLWFIPTYEFTGQYQDDYVQLSGAYWATHLGLLRKPLGRATTSSALQTPVYIPSQVDFDYSEAEWLKTWQHQWWPAQGQALELVVQPAGSHVIGVSQCNDVHTTGLPDNSFVDGTGTINIETDCMTPTCFDCEVTNSNVIQTNASAKIPDPWHVHFDIQKRIPMREDQELYLMLDWHLYTVPAQPLANPGWNMAVTGGIKTVIEMG